MGKQAQRTERMEENVKKMSTQTEGSRKTLFWACLCRSSGWIATNANHSRKIFLKSNIQSIQLFVAKMLKKKIVEKENDQKAPRKMYRRAAKNSACGFLQHKTFSMGENMLAAGDVARFYSGHRRYLFEHQKL